jgi:hypothetical protein
MPILSFKSLEEEDQPKAGDKTLIPLSDSLHSAAFNAARLMLGMPAEEVKQNEQSIMNTFADVAFEEKVIFQKGKNSPNSYLPTGFPQGANISPFLSIIQLAMRGTPKFADILMYADDGLIYAKKKFDAIQVQEFFKELGLNIAPEKSG